MAGGKRRLEGETVPSIAVRVGAAGRRCGEGKRERSFGSSYREGLGLGGLDEISHHMLIYGTGIIIFFVGDASAVRVVAGFFFVFPPPIR